VSLFGLIALEVLQKSNGDASCFGGTSETQTVLRIDYQEDDLDFTPLHTKNFTQAMDKLAFTMLLANSSQEAQSQMLHAMETRTWLTTMPNSLNGIILSVEEFWDSLWLHLGCVLLDLPDHCIGCGQSYWVGHALACKKGDSVLLRLNDVVVEWHHQDPHKVLANHEMEKKVK
jgi:hypothetical protein